MLNLESYNEFENFINSLDIKKISKLSDINIVKNSPDYIDDFLQCKSLYHIIKNSDFQDYIFDKKEITCDVIKKYMLEYLSKFQIDIDETKNEWIEYYGSIDALNEDEETFEDHFSNSYRDSGYAGISEYKDILNFWKNLDDDKILSIAYNMVIEDYDIDLNGYRHYWLNQSSIELLCCFYVIKNNLHIDNYYVEDDIDMLYFNQFNLFNNIKYNEIQTFCEDLDNLELNQNIERYNYFIENIIKNFKDDKHFKKQLKKLEKLKL